jgi:prepilin peptidase CpaA
MSLAIWLTLGGCAIAGFLDIRFRRIPNWLTGSLALAALILHGLGGVWPLVNSLVVMLVLTAAGALIYSRGGIGGGDIKLAIAGSGMLGFPLCVPFLLYTAIGGGLLAIFFILARRDARETASHVMLMAMGGSQGVAAGKRETLPYAAAFAFGAVLVALSQSIAPFLRITV